MTQSSPMPSNTPQSSAPSPAGVAPAVVLATRNQGKVRELDSLLQPLGIRVLGLDSFPSIGEIEETGTTFAENALLKASTVSKLSGLVAIADDSGLEVDALGGAPGVYSARYSEEPGKPATDERNIEKVLALTAAVPDGQRGIRFCCTMAACASDGRHILAEGAWEGLLARAPAGDNGFGYDPVFFDPELGRTVAQLSREEKNSRSHRAKAVQGLLALWPAFWQAVVPPR